MIGRREIVVLRINHTRERCEHGRAIRVTDCLKATYGDGELGQLGGVVLNLRGEQVAALRVERLAVLGGTANTQKSHAKTAMREWVRIWRKVMNGTYKTASIGKQNPMPETGLGIVMSNHCHTP